MTGKRNRKHWLVGSAGIAPVAALAFAAPQHQTGLLQEAQAVFSPLPTRPAALALTPQESLGRALFWDTRLSANGKIACASCHAARDGGADRRPFSLDARGKNTTRNSQTIFNAMLQPMLRWTGDRKDGAHQAERSLTGSLGFTKADDVLPLLKQYGYEPRFQEAFPTEEISLTPQHYARAIQSYETTLLTPAPFDRYLSGQERALTSQQKAGLQLFLKTGCASCHKGVLLGGNSLAKFTGIEGPDSGLFESSKKDEDKHIFRVSMLRNIEKTGPYFHDGSVKSLPGAVELMAQAQLGKTLTPAETGAIVAFLRSLTGKTPRHYSAPEGRVSQGRSRKAL